MTTIITRGAASAQALGYAARATAANYIEDVFSTYLYTGNGTTQTITNGIDLSTKGGLVWIKNRGSAVNHALVDTARGSGQYLSSNTTTSNTSTAGEFTGFTTSGFSLDSLVSSIFNGNNETYASWTFRKQAKFFDVVTYTGNGSTGRAISHNLGSVPGSMIVKSLSDAGSWGVYHRSLAANNIIRLNLANAANADLPYFFGDDVNSIAPTSTTFTVASGVNASSKEYVVYLFAHDAGGFGASGTDNVISCGSFTTNTAETVTVNLGYEPQFVIVKRSDAVGDWYVLDTMRGWNNSSSDAILYPNYSNAEGSGQRGEPNATGFRFTEGPVARTYIYIAIRRGPMKTPTSGTSVYNADTRGSATATANGTSYYSGFPVDLSIGRNKSFAGGDTNVYDRLRGNPTLWTNLTNAESPVSYYFDSNQGFWGTTQTANANQFYWMFRRAPGFFDVVCYTGTGSATTQSHNLGVVPELMIFKRRDAAAQWQFYFSALGNTKTVQCPDLDISTSSGYFNNTSPTSSVFTVNTVSSVNASGGTYVAYLAASCAGVSKVGSYTGTGSTQTINCGFSGGARFVLIKNVGSNAYAYPFYVWDTARGMISGTDPSLQLNSTAAEVNANSVYTTSSGFQIVSTATGINGNGESFVYWAIA